MVEEGKVEMIRSVRGLARNLFISKHNGQVFTFSQEHVFNSNKVSQS